MRYPCLQRFFDGAAKQRTKEGKVEQIKLARLAVAAAPYLIDKPYT